ncbi:hypothetical protein ACTA71_010454 [Dictyostelium dimigraforme]
MSKLLFSLLLIFTIISDIVFGNIDSVSHMPMNIPDRNSFNENTPNNLVYKQTYYAPPNVQVPTKLPSTTQPPQTQPPQTQTPHLSNPTYLPTSKPQQNPNLNDNLYNNNYNNVNNLRSANSNTFTSNKPVMVTKTFSNDTPVKQTPPPTSQPTTRGPVISQPITREPVTSQPITGEPVIGQPTTKEPVTSQPISREPMNNEPNDFESVSTNKPQNQPNNKQPNTNDNNYQTHQPLQRPSQIEQQKPSYYSAPTSSSPSNSQISKPNSQMSSQTPAFFKPSN